MSEPSQTSRLGGRALAPGLRLIGRFRYVTVGWASSHRSERAFQMPPLRTQHPEIHPPAFTGGSRSWSFLMVEKTSETNVLLEVNAQTKLFRNNASCFLLAGLAEYLFLGGCWRVMGGVIIFGRVGATICCPGPAVATPTDLKTLTRSDRRQVSSTPLGCEGATGWWCTCVLRVHARPPPHQTVTLFSYGALCQVWQH